MGLLVGVHYCWSFALFLPRAALFWESFLKFRCIPHSGSIRRVLSFEDLAHARQRYSRKCFIISICWSMCRLYWVFLYELLFNGQGCSSFRFFQQILLFHMCVFIVKYKWYLKQSADALMICVRFASNLIPF